MITISSSNSQRCVFHVLPYPSVVILTKRLWELPGQDEGPSTPLAITTHGRILFIGSKEMFYSATH